MVMFEVIVVDTVIYSRLQCAKDIENHVPNKSGVVALNNLFGRLITEESSYRLHQTYK